MYELTITQDEAREITTRLRAAATEFFSLIEEAFQRGAHTALGYRTFRAYLDGEFPEFVPPKFDRISRNDVIAGLLTAGMSTRDAAKVTGVTEGTVRNSTHPKPETGIETIIRLHAEIMHVDHLRALAEDLYRSCDEDEKRKVDQSLGRIITDPTPSDSFYQAYRAVAISEE